MIVIKNLDSIPQVVIQVLKFVGNRRKILLYGEMGVGKTTFTKAFCAHLGVKENTSSPTFSLVNSYRYLDQQGIGQVIHHLDLYRLKNTAEALDIGIEDYLFDNHYCIIEWPQVIETLVPDDVVKIRIDLLDNLERNLVFL
jgi:tRNA threonylcarbamoyladenosine biosynthesis protein TsaE